MTPLSLFHELFKASEFTALRRNCCIIRTFLSPLLLLRAAVRATMTSLLCHAVTWYASWLSLV